jgi:RND family efflux transporter MFP subunit
MVAAADQRELMEWNEYTGRTAPVEFVEVRPRISGHIQEVRFSSGQLVKKGDVLFVIDPRWQRAELDRREAELLVAKVRNENAEREAKRTPQLLAGRAISQEEADTREARFQEAKSALLAAEAARNFTHLDLEHTEVRSPIDGRVSRAMVTTGNYVSGLAGGATLLTTVVSIDPVYVYVDMDENSLLKFNALQRSGKVSTDANTKVPVELELADETGFPHKGVVESLDNHVDPQSGSILLRALFPNTDGRIIPGLFARIRVPASERHPVLLIPETAVGTDQAQKFVLTLTSTNTAAYRPVKLGSLVDGKRVVREGLAPGERILVTGLAKVRPGMPVTPQDAATAGSKPGAAPGGQH